MIDKLKYKIFGWLWLNWHSRFRRYFDSFTPTDYGYLGEMRLPYAKYIFEDRPWWHMCCNGDCGGWRTTVCTYLEDTWRGTDYYRREDVDE